MTYSIDYRKQVLSSIDNGLTVREAAAVLIVDGAGWHQGHMSVENVSLLKLPPYSLELNPVEQVWQWIKQNHLSNRCYKDYNEILDACCKAWNSFANRIDLVQSIGTREWATVIV